MGARKPRHSLEEYRSKRRFDRTPEPRGTAKPARGKAPARFCIQKHLATRLHYDLRLEHDGVLLSWAVPKGPSLNPREKRLAMRTEDHPIEYADFEGVIPEGYGTGIVMLWDEGTWRPRDDGAGIDRALEKGKLDFELDGYKLKGSWSLVRTARAAGGERSSDRSWILIKHRDHWSGEVDVTEVAPLSIKTDRDFTEILSERPDIWESHRATRSSGALERVIRRAVEMREARERAVQAKRKTRARS